MNGCRCLFKKEGYQQVVDLGYGYSVRVGRYDLAMDGVELVSAIEVLRATMPTEAEIASMEAEAVEKEKARVVAEIEGMAASPEVKRFVRGGVDCWWDSETRASIRASLEARAEGWYLEFGGEVVEYATKEAALAVVDSIEVYASECHRAVCEAVAEIGGLETVAAVRGYSVEWPEVVTVDN